MSLARLTRHDDRSRTRNLPPIIRFALVAACLAGFLAAGAQAGRSSPLPESKPLRIAVIGDSIANELGRGLEALFRKHRNVRIVKYTRVATGLVRTDYFNWNAALQRFLARHRPDAIVVNIGGNDRQNMVIRGRRVNRFSRSWRIQYQRRVDRFMDLLQQERSPVYWVGLPLVRSQRMSRDYRILNRIFHREAQRHRFTYVSIWEAFAGPGGRFTSYGRSLNGAKTRLRNEDGMHFTAAGRLRLAAHVARAMRLR